MSSTYVPSPVISRGSSRRLMAERKSRGVPAFAVVAAMVSLPLLGAGERFAARLVQVAEERADHHRREHPQRGAGESRAVSTRADSGPKPGAGAEKRAGDERQQVGVRLEHHEERDDPDEHADEEGALGADRAVHVERDPRPDATGNSA